MQKKVSEEPRRRILFCLCVLSLLTAIVFLPNGFPATAESNLGEEIAHKTFSHETNLENYDIRSAKDERAADLLISYRQTEGTTADFWEKFVKGEETLRRIVPSLKVEYNRDIRIPEVIGLNPNSRANLSEAHRASRAETLRNFIKGNNNLLGVENDQAEELETIADYTNPDGNLSFAHLAQRINGYPVFRGEIKAGFSKDGAMFRIINNLAPGLDGRNISNDFGDPNEAVKFAAANLGYELKSSETAINEKLSNDAKVTFGEGDWATTAEKMYFPLEPGIAIPSWRVAIWQPTNAYYIIVDAKTGTILWRKNTTEDQTQAATYNVYGSDSPTPGSPVPSTTTPAMGFQPPVVERTNFTLIGNEAPNAFNNLGWITDGNNTTDGNNVEAGIDRDGTNGVDPAGRATGLPNRVFNYLYNPNPGNPAPGEDPLATTYPPISQFQQGAVTNLFYITNRYHDSLYRLGFTEAARNFQNDNFGRGGVAGDRVSGEAQDSAGTNNANFNAMADGVRGRMQMYIFTNTSGRRDGDLDAEVVIHELTHGTSNRLIGNGSGLSTTEARGMGEGWSDFYGRALLSTPDEDINGIYPSGGYATNFVFGIGSSNYYYGIRRFPYALKTTVGGPDNRPFNPLTFADIDASQANISDGAFNASPSFAGNSATEVHNAGEVWCMALLEVRARIIGRLGFAAGNDRVLQIVTDGMKLTPDNPSFIQARDAIIAADIAGFGGADTTDIYAGFAVRGMGFGATSDGSNHVTESFELPNLVQTPMFSFSDASGNGNGFADPGEKILLDVPINNPLAEAALGVTVSASGGASVSYGTIGGNATVTKQIPFTVPASQACGNVLTFTITANSNRGVVTFTRQIVIGQPVISIAESFDSVTAPALPAGWTAAATGSGVAWVTTTNLPDTAPNAIFTNDPSSLSSSEIVTPEIPVQTTASQANFRLNYDTETGFDGMVLEISVGGGAFQDILAAGGSFLSGGYPRSVASGGSNPIAGRQAWTGNSGGYIDVSVLLPASANGQTIKLKFRTGSDISVGGTGVRIDGVKIVNGFNCAAVAASGNKRADFDGDGKTDLSVFRPSDGVWYLNRSSAGFTATTWGASTDMLVPGDYDGDGKTDTAVFRGGAWYILKSGTNSFQAITWGAATDKPVPGDYDGDGKTDAAVFRPSGGVWYVLNSGGGGFSATVWGQNGDTLVPGDYDGDGKTDTAVIRAGVWYINGSTSGFTATAFGTVSDLPVPADYDGDGKDDIAVFRPTDGNWYRYNSSNGQFNAVLFGQTGDIPVPGDYDGDGKYDEAVVRSGVWYLNQSRNGFAGAAFGFGTDVAIPKQYIP